MNPKLWVKVFGWIYFLINNNGFIFFDIFWLQRKEKEKKEKEKKEKQKQNPLLLFTKLLVLFQKRYIHYHI